MNNWIPLLFRFARRQNMSQLFNRRRNNRGILWASILGIGVSVAAYGLGKNQNKNLFSSFQNLMNNFRMGNNQQISNMSALTELSKEIAPVKNQLPNK